MKIKNRFILFLGKWRFVDFFKGELNKALYTSKEGKRSGSS